MISWFRFAERGGFSGDSEASLWGFPKPPWPTLKHHLFRAFIPRKLFRSLRDLRVRDKNGEFKQERLFRRVAKIPISRPFNELVEMDFVYDWVEFSVSASTRYFFYVLIDYLYGGGKEGGLLKRWRMLC